ncbi:MAG: hypothetical protein M3R50_01840 [Bacteroidota bacterium]|nr:hypothetical protein [Bacteroidota bacterium]
MNIKRLCIVALGLFFLLAACNKEKGKGNGGGNRNLGSGNLYYEWDQGMLKLDLATGVKSRVSSSPNGWDISSDGTKMLQSTDDAASNYNKEYYTITNLKDGTVVNKFVRNSGYGNPTYPLFSPDMTLIAVPKTNDVSSTLLILNMQGEVLHSVGTISGKSIGKHICWMPDNTVIVSVGNTLYRLNKAFDYGNVITTFNFSGWGDFAASPDGSKIAFEANKHIWMMNTDGSDLKQITDSDDEEGIPQFSPDGSHLLIAGQLQESGTGAGSTGSIGNIWNLVLIPADGKMYNIREGADKNVIPVIAKGENSPEPCDGGMLWR